MRIGIDFDNTIVCYDQIFHRVAREKEVIPPEVPVNKTAVRDYLRQAGLEPIWTEMQGYVYGPRLNEAQAFPGVIDFIKQAVSESHEVFIISHKTRHPYLGEKHDLHQAAWGWLQLNGFFLPTGVGLTRDHVFFQEAKVDKLSRIGECRCDVFIDDLPEILNAPEFPSGVDKILFDPSDQYPNQALVRFGHWAGVDVLLALCQG